jgi:hypothetical protein
VRAGVLFMQSSPTKTSVRKVKSFIKHPKVS